MNYLLVFSKRIFRTLYKDAQRVYLFECAENLNLVRVLTESARNKFCFYEGTFLLLDLMTRKTRFGNF